MNPNPIIADEHVTLWHGDCLDVLATLNDDCIDAVVTDPPYGLDFMGKHWDTGAVAFDTAVWGHCLRVLKPGGHVVAFGGTRTWHRLAVAIEDAGFEIRDNLAWLYGSGERPTAGGVAHPTVKPLDLMRWLVRLVTPPGGVVLDPFAGSGTTAEACIHEHRTAIVIEREADYLPLIQARLSKPMEIGFNFGEGA